VLESYLHLYLSSSKHLKPEHDFNLIANWTLAPYTIGHHVGSKWGLGRVMKWVPTVDKERLKNHSDKADLLRGVGLYKVQGDAVAAVMGTIFEQFVRLFIVSSWFLLLRHVIQGGSVALRAFHTRVLPNLLIDGVNGGLPVIFHSEVRQICKSMGGPEGDLTKPLPERA
jgi:hypothetical protein